MVHWRLLVLTSIFALLFFACDASGQRLDVGVQATVLPQALGNDPTATAEAHVEPGPAASTESAGVASEPVSTCPITRPPDPPFTPPEPTPRQAPGEDFWYGSDSLWTALPQNGMWADLPHHPEGYTQKLVWGRKGYSWTKEPEPPLTVSGRRIDGPAPSLRADKATNAYAADIGSAMMVGIDFPTLGCWEINGSYQEAELSFVVWVGAEQVFPLTGGNSDLEALKLAAMGEQARQIAQKEEPELVLRQVDTDLNTTDFQFVDKTLTRVVTVIVPGPDAPVDQWYTTVDSVLPLLSHAEPDLDLRNLRAGPTRVAQAMRAHWPGGTLRGVMLYREKGQLT
jgi:hypothetical protein